MGKSKSAGVILMLSVCIALTNGQSYGDLRLIDNSGNSLSTSSGRLEIYLNGEWGSICSKGIGIPEANLACKQLNFLYATRSTNVSELGLAAGTGINYFVVCYTRNTLLVDCITNTFDTCGHEDDAAITCSNSPDPLRLISQTGETTNLSSGRLEIFIDNQWGTVCNNFDIQDAHTACRQLGFTAAYSYRWVSFYDEDQVSSSVPIWLESSHCTFSSTNLRNCSRLNVGTSSSCTHDDDVIVSCLGSGALRLLGSSEGPKGRLEIYHNGTWGTVCNNRFDVTEANSACRQLGFSKSTRRGTVGDFGYHSGSGMIWLDGVSCPIPNVPLLQCGHSGLGDTNCSHSEDVALECLNLKAESNLLDAPIIKAIIAFGTIMIVIMILPIAIPAVVVCCLAGRAHYRKRKKQKLQEQQSLSMSNSAAQDDDDSTGNPQQDDTTSLTQAQQLNRAQPEGSSQLQNDSSLHGYSPPSQEPECSTQQQGDHAPPEGSIRQQRDCSPSQEPEDSTLQQGDDIPSGPSQEPKHSPNNGEITVM